MAAALNTCTNVGPAGSVSGAGAMQIDDLLITLDAEEATLVADDDDDMTDEEPAAAAPAARVDDDMTDEEPVSAAPAARVDDDMTDEEPASAAPAAQVDDDMTDEDTSPSKAARGQILEPVQASQQQVAEDPCRDAEMPDHVAGVPVAVDDNGADRSEDVAEVSQIKELNVEALRKKPKPVQIAVYKAKIAELQSQKTKLMEAEDFIGAQEMKQKIKKHEEALAAVRGQLCAAALPSPARAQSRSAATLSSSAAHDEAAPEARLEHADEIAIASCDHAGATEVEQKSVGEVGASESTEQVVPPGEVAASEQEKETRAPADRQQGDSDAKAPAPRWRESRTQGMIELAGDERPHPFMIPSSVFERLYEYQQDGVAWLAQLWLHHQGGVLADEMGLGKTIQICALLHGARKSGATHALILLPVTLLDQWAREAKLWCPGWPVYTYYGNAFQRAQALRGVSLPQGGILLTSYSMLSNTEQLFEVAVAETKKAPPPRPGPKRRKTENLDTQTGDSYDPADAWEEAELPPTKLPAAGETKQWDIVVCDEAHRMKSISSLFSKSVRRLRAQCRLLLTGTPVQNSLQDLWALMDFAMPGILGNHATFVKEFGDPIDKGSVRGASAYHLTLKNRLAEQLRGIIGPHMLRRTKVGSGLVVADESVTSGVAADDDEFAEFESAQLTALPSKRETIIWLLPSDEQAAIYRKVLEASDVIREAASKSALSIEVFRAIGLLKRLCNHPQLILPTLKPGAWGDLLAEATDSLPEPVVPEDAVVPSDAPPDELAEAGVSKGNVGQVNDDARAGRAAEMMARRLPRSADDLLAQSAKLRCMALLLPALAKRGHRTLVFSQSVKMLDLVQICVLKPHGLRCLRIDGQTDPSARAQKVNKFQEQTQRFQCMLLTTGVGGVGLNLTSADRVVMVDPAWNPATDAQAVDRAYRIGQDKEVRVYRLVTSGLIEDKMFRLQVYKMGLTKTALETEQQHHLFTAREIRALFEWTDPAMGETRKLLNVGQNGETDSSVQEAADDDGAAAEGWFGDWIAAGMSDFAAFNRNAAASQSSIEIDKTVEMKVEEVRQKLSSAEERARSLEEAHKAVEEKRTAAEQGIVEAAAGISECLAARAAADEAIKEKRGLLKAARSAEAAAQMQLKKALGAQISAQDAQMKAMLVEKKSEDLAMAPMKLAEKTRSALRVANDAVPKALGDAKGVLQDSAWDTDSGKGPYSAVKVYPTTMRRAQKALERVRAALETAAIRQSDVEAIEDELTSLDVRPGETGRPVAEFRQVCQSGSSGSHDARAMSDAAPCGKPSAGCVQHSDQFDAAADVESAASEKDNRGKGTSSPHPAPSVQQEPQPEPQSEPEPQAQLQPQCGGQEQEKQRLRQQQAAKLTDAERERVRRMLEQRQSTSHARAEAARETASSAVAAFVDAGLAFVDAFERSSQRVVKMGEVKAAQATAKFIFKEFGSAWTTCSKAQEAWLKACVSRSKTAQRLAAARIASKEAGKAVTDAQSGVASATQVAEDQLEACRYSEKALAEAQGAREKAEAEEAYWRQKREEFRGEVMSARSGIKSARAAAKEAAAEQKAVLAQVKRVEKVGQRVEAAKSSALERLRSEKYDAHQVELAYELKKKGGPNDADLQLQLKRAQSAQMQASEAHTRALQGLKQYEEGFAASSKAAEETRSAARTAEENLSKAYVDAESVLQDPSTLDAETKRSGWRNPVEITGESMAEAQKALEQVRSSLDTTAIRQSEVEDVEDELLALNTGAEYTENERECVRYLLEQSQGKAHAHAETARESTSLAVTTFLGEALSFVGAFERASHRAVKMEEVKASQLLVRGIFKQLSSAWTASRRTQEAWLKAAAARSKCAQKLAAARSAAEEASASLKDADEALAVAAKVAEEELEASRSATEAEKAREQEAKVRAAQKLQDAEQTAAAKAELAEQRRAAARLAEEALSKCYEDALAVLKDSTFDADGRGEGLCAAVDVAPASLRRTAKALERVRAALDTVAIRQLEVEDVEDELLAMGAARPESLDASDGQYTEKELEQVRKLLRSSQGKAHTFADSAREATCAAIAAFLEVGHEFANGFFVKSNKGGKAAKSEKLKATQAAVKTVFKELSSAWTASRKAQEAWIKAAEARSSAAQTVAVSRAHALELGAAPPNPSCASTAAPATEDEARSIAEDVVMEVSTPSTAASSKRQRPKASADEVVETVQPRRLRVKTTL